MDVKKLPFGKLFSGENRLRLIVGLGILGMALILLSQMLGDSGEERPTDTATADFTSEQYIADMEAKLQNLITGIEGVGRAKVMVTLESGVENVYLQEEKRSADTSREGDSAAEVSARVYSKENVEQKYILVDQNGKKQPVLLTQLQPKIQGVIIVCEGAGSIRVQQNLINVVTTALNVPSTRVCVVKIDSGEITNMQEEAQ